MLKKTSEKMIKKAILITIILAIIITQQANAETWPVKWKNEYIMQSALGSETVHVNEIITASMAAGLVSSTLAATGNCGTAAAVMGAAEIGIIESQPIPKYAKGGKNF